MFKITETNPNYLAKIVQLEEPVKHPNADKLLGWVIDHNRVWTDTSYKTGDICVYFPLECCINPELLSFLNLFRDKTLNQNPEETGFFEKHGRVRAIKLRGEPSEGFLLPYKELMRFIESKNENFLTDGFSHADINEEFDSYEDIWICKKYIPRNNKRTHVQGEPKKKKIIELLVDGQFKFHRDTEQLRRHIEEVQPEDIISITYKMHGTSGVFSNILVKRILSPVERLLRFFGVKIQESKYGNVYSSRTVIKNVDGKCVSEGGFYGIDLWEIINERIKDKILQGITIYSEIVGYLPTGQFIQDGFDYGCAVGDCENYVYRITYTNPEGHVFEFDWQAVKDYCEKYGLKYVPELYYGKAEDFTTFWFMKTGQTGNVFQTTNAVDFSDKLLASLSEAYLEKDCTMCKNKIPAEGIVLRIEKGIRPAYKLKSFRFLELETKQLDKEPETDQIIEE